MGANLESFRRYADDRAGVVEEFLDLEAPASGATAILCQPGADTRRTGFVIARSPAPEHGPLRRLEAAVARRLAGAGFPSVRLRRGISDDGTPAEIRIADRVAEASWAVDVLRERTGVERVGVLSGLLGAAVALLVAEDQEVAMLGLWEPVIDGPATLRTLQLTARAEALTWRRADSSDLVRGMVLSEQARSDLSALDVTQAAAAYRGKALLVSITIDGEPTTPVKQLAELMQGAETTVAAVNDPLRTPFGEPFIRMRPLDGKYDVRVALDRRLAQLTTDWATEAA